MQPSNKTQALLMQLVYTCSPRCQHACLRPFNSWSLVTYVAYVTYVTLLDRTLLPQQAKPKCSPTTQKSQQIVTATAMHRSVPLCGWPEMQSIPCGPNNKGAQHPGLTDHNVGSPPGIIMGHGSSDIICGIGLRTSAVKSSPQHDHTSWSSA